MTKIYLFFMFLFGVTALSAQRIKGSDTLLPLTQTLSESYMKAHPTAQISVTGGGSGVGLSAINDQTADIAMSSRQIKFTEKMKLRQKGIDIREVVVARDALAVIVHPANKVDKLTREQLEAVFRGKITDWKDLAGNPGKIIVYSRETSSGTYEFFKESVLANRNYMAGVLSMPATGAVIQSVRQTRGAIGYVGLAYLNPYVKALEVSYHGAAFASASLQDALEGKYPIVRPLYYYYDAANEQQVLPFIDYILSEQGQALVQKIGFIPVK